MALYHVKSNTVGDFTGTVTVFNSAGSTVTANATDLVRPGDWNSVHNIIQNIGGNTAGTSQVSGSDIVWAGGNNITLSASSGAVTISGPSLTQYLTTAALSNHSHNFATTTTNGSVAVVATTNSLGATLAMPAFITTYVAQTTQTQPAGNIAGVGYTSTTQAGTSLGITHNTAGLSLAQPLFLTTAAQSDHSHSNPTLFLTNISGTTASASNGFTLSLSAAAPGGGAVTPVSFFQPELYGATTTISHANGTLYLRAFANGDPIDLDRYLFQQSGASSATTMSVSGSVSAGNASSGTGTWGQTGTVLLFSRVSTDEANANFNSIISFGSQTYSMSAGYSLSASWSTNVSSATVSWTTSAGVGFIKNIDSQGNVTTSATTSSASSSFSSTSTNANSISSSYIMSFPYAHFSGFRPLNVPGNSPTSISVIQPADYWVGVIQSSNSGSTNYPLQRVAMMSNPGALYFTASTNNYMEMGSSVAITTGNWRPGFGSYSASSQTTTAIPLSQVSLMASNASLYVALVGHTL